MMERNQAHKQTVNRKKVFHLQRQTMNERTFTDATLTNTNSDNEDEFPITQFSPLMLETHHKNLPIPTPFHPNIHQELLLRILTDTGCPVSPCITNSSDGGRNASSSQKNKKKEITCFAFSKDHTKNIIRYFCIFKIKLN